MAEQRPRQTHRLRRDGELITKTYRSWSRDEHRREWAVLERLATRRPGLAPEPVRADLEAEPPSITMTAIPGAAISGRWSDEQVRLLAEAMNRLWSTPYDGLPPLDMYQPGYWRDLVAGSDRPTSGIAMQAYDIATGWVAGPDVARLLDGRFDVLGHGDPQPGNLLYDGEQIRLVDFEDAGAGDLCFELANLAEHLGTRLAGLDRVVGLVDHDPRRYLLFRRLLAVFWLIKLLPDPTGVRPPRTAELRDQSLRLLDLFG
ncbi:hypothetical protein GCM10027613_42030 [Microlunatus endophyticus]|uniref:phosphotransferase family protein n=1 Tax=Microlunatus endophyticus TaxID=1716077 RepID=UPI0016678993|nr:aminoglycoside phosphotransferase family protein [Microlunatus endophyticus]